VEAPTLLIVGSNDTQVLALNRRALAALGTAQKKLAVVEGATHLFEEPGTLEEVAWLATDWFTKYLRVPVRTTTEESQGSAPPIDASLRFRDRHEAGRFLASKLKPYARRSDVLVLALPRGGVPVAFEVARELHAPLDLFLVRKLGLPQRAELAMGAIATGGVRVVNDEVVSALGVPEEVIDAVAEEEQRELQRRERLYRGDRPPPHVNGRTVLLIDDGLATGSTMRAAVAALRQQNPAKIVVAVPVAASDTCDEFQAIADEVVCARTPNPFFAVGLWYLDFSQTTDEEVRHLLAMAAEDTASDPTRN
jgi:putative phosphoribosyl transferase